MAFEAEVIGWADRYANVHDGVPPDLSQCYSVRVEAIDEETGQRQYWWQHTGEPFSTWQEWMDLIYTFAENEYGLEMVA